MHIFSMLSDIWIASSFFVMDKALVTFSLSPVHTQGGLVEA